MAQVVYNELVRKNPVYHSNNYDLIEVFEFNRFTGIGEPLKIEQVANFEKRLKKTIAMLSNGFNPHIPILCGLVDGNLKTCDGGHRIVACKHLGIPYYYEVDETLDTVEKIADTTFSINNNGDKWNALDKVANASVGPNFTPEQKADASKILNLSTKYGVALTTVLYIASNGSGHKADVLTKKNFSIADDTEIILDLAKVMSLKNANNGISLLKKDKFVESVMLAYRRGNATTFNNLLKRANSIKVPKNNTRFEWNKTIEKAANYNLSNCETKVYLNKR